MVVFSKVLLHECEVSRVWRRAKVALTKPSATNLVWSCRKRYLYIFVFFHFLTLPSLNMHAHVRTHCFSDAALRMIFLSLHCCHLEAAT